MLDVRKFSPDPMKSLAYVFVMLTDEFTNFMHTILLKVVPDNLKACRRFVRHSNKICMYSGFQVLKYHR